MTPHELRTRLALDARVVARLRSPHLGAIRAFASPTHLQRGKDASEAELVGGMAAYWAVEYQFPMLAGPGRPLSRAVAVFDLLAGGNYPYTAPAVSFVTRPFPWCGHVHRGCGSVCLGTGWERARGQITLAHLVIHVLRLANFHEPATDDGNNHEALIYGRDDLGGRPLNPELVYPALPADLLHGVTDEEEDVRRPAVSVFTPREPTTPCGTLAVEEVFRPRGNPFVPTSSAFFLARGAVR